MEVEEEVLVEEVVAVQRKVSLSKHSYATQDGQ